MTLREILGSYCLGKRNLPNNLKVRPSFLLIIILTFVFAPSCFGQVAKIVNVTGNVKVLEKPDSNWQKAKPNMYLDRSAEIKTKKSSECTVAFDEELKNILTVKENSHITIEDLKPAKVYLPRGRVFSLVEDLAKIEGFQVRTPTAVAGVRGTGDSVEALIDSTIIKCFEGIIFAQGLDSGGKTTGEINVFGGSGLDVGLGGDFKETFNLTNDDYNEWGGFKESLREAKIDSELEEKSSKSTTTLEPDNQNPLNPTQRPGSYRPFDHTQEPGFDTPLDHSNEDLGFFQDRSFDSESQDRELDGFRDAQRDSFRDEFFRRKRKKKEKPGSGGQD